MFSVCSTQKDYCVLFGIISLWWYPESAFSREARTILKLTTFFFFPFSWTAVLYYLLCNVKILWSQIFFSSFLIAYSHQTFLGLSNRELQNSIQTSSVALPTGLHVGDLQEDEVQEEHSELFSLLPCFTWRAFLGYNFRILCTLVFIALRNAGLQLPKSK